MRNQRPSPGDILLVLLLAALGAGQDVAPASETAPVPAAPITEVANPKGWKIETARRPLE